MATDAAGSEEWPRRRLRSKRQRLPAIGDHDEERPAKENKEACTCYWGKEEAALEIEIEMPSNRRQIKQASRDSPPM